MQDVLPALADLYFWGLKRGVWYALDPTDEQLEHIPQAHTLAGRLGVGAAELGAVLDEAGLTVRAKSSTWSKRINMSVTLQRAWLPFKSTPLPGSYVRWIAFDTAELQTSPLDQLGLCCGLPQPWPLDHGRIFSKDLAHSRRRVPSVPDPPTPAPETPGGGGGGGDGDGGGGGDGDGDGAATVPRPAARAPVTVRGIFEALGAEPPAGLGGIDAQPRKQFVDLKAGGKQRAAALKLAHGAVGAVCGALDPCGDGAALLAAVCAGVMGAAPRGLSSMATSYARARRRNVRPAPRPRPKPESAAPT